MLVVMLLGLSLALQLSHELRRRCLHTVETTPATVRLKSRQCRPCLLMYHGPRTALVQLQTGGG